MSYGYDVALSFAGEDRPLAEFLANSVVGQFRVFYDHFEKAELWGSDLSASLPERYENSRYCVILVSDHYLNKMWTVLERQHIIAEFLKRRGENFILPIRLSGFAGKVPGLSALTGYISVRERRDWDMALEALLKKLSA